jgi:divalent metal cation (Fe/Co/Zn/Cd) transporter
MPATGTDRAAMQRRALLLEYATIAWNLGEAVLTIGLGVAAGSLALVGFGTDSIIEVFASSVVVWHVRPGHETDHPQRTRLALRLVAVAFGVLAVVLATVSIRDLVTGRRAEESLFGIAYLAVTACVMFALAAAKRRLAGRLDSAPLRSEASMTFLDGILATATLTGLALNAALGWWWADPAAALLVAVAAANEARENAAEASRVGMSSLGSSLG